MCRVNMRYLYFIVCAPLAMGILLPTLRPEVSCSKNKSCPGGGVCIDSTTRSPFNFNKSNGQGICLGIRCDQRNTNPCPGRQVCGSLYLGMAGQYGSHGAEYGDVPRCLDLSMACGESGGLSCRCPDGFDCIKGNWNRNTLSPDQTPTRGWDLNFCGPRKSAWVDKCDNWVPKPPPAQKPPPGLETRDRCDISGGKGGRGTGSGKSVCNLSFPLR
jgi:hypothetical protein